MLFYKAVSAYLHFIISSVHPPSSFSKPSEPHNGPPPGTVYFAPSARSYRADLPHVHLPAASIETLIHPSGLTGAVPLGDAYLSPLMRTLSLRKGAVAGLGATEREKERIQYNVMVGCEVLTAFLMMDYEWEITKLRSRTISTAASLRMRALEDDLRIFDIACKCNFNCNTLDCRSIAGTQNVQQQQKVQQPKKTFCWFNSQHGIAQHILKHADVHCQAFSGFSFSTVIWVFSFLLKFSLCICL